MSLFETSPEGLREQVYAEINSVNPDGWLARSREDRLAIVLSADPLSGYVSVSTDYTTHPFFDRYGNLTISSDPDGICRGVNTTKLLDIANRHGLSPEECYEGPLWVASTAELPITPVLISFFSELVAVTEFER
jgi:hypothetical protein